MLTIDVRRKRNGVKIDLELIRLSVLIAIANSAIVPDRVHKELGLTPYPRGSREVINAWLAENHGNLQNIRIEILPGPANRIVVTQTERIANVALFDRAFIQDQSALRRAIIDAVNSGFDASQRDDSFTFSHEWDRRTEPRSARPGHRAATNQHQAAHGR